MKHAERSKTIRFSMAYSGIYQYPYIQQYNQPCEKMLQTWADPKSQCLYYHAYNFHARGYKVKVC